MDLFSEISERIFTFNEVPEAPNGLMEKTSVAPEELSKEGVDVD